MADSNQWCMPDRWHWVEYPVGWLQCLSWLGNTRWPGRSDDELPEPQRTLTYARFLIKEVYWAEIGDGRGRDWPDVELTPLGGVAIVSEFSHSIRRVLPGIVSVARSRGYTWAAIGRALGVGRTAAHKRFANVASSFPYDGHHRRSYDVLADIRQNMDLRSAVGVLLRDLVVQARCEGFRWAEISDALGVVQTAAQKRFGLGLRMGRIPQLDAELVWLRNAAPDSISRADLEMRVKIRQRAG